MDCTKLIAFGTPFIIMTAIFAATLRRLSVMREAVKGINIATLLSADEVRDIVKECLR